MGEDRRVACPLCVDLDGTLIKTDLLWESLLALLKQSPFSLFRLPFWLLKNRMNCFGYMDRESGHRRVPEPPDKITG